MRSLIMLGVLFISLTTNAQKTFDSRSKIGVVVGTGTNDIAKYKRQSGCGGREGKGYFLAGISYLKPLKKWWALETGIEYTHHKIKASSAPMPEQWYWNTSASIISIPVNARFNFGNYFFAQGGLLLDMDISDKEDIDKQTGIGASLGLGGKYDFKKGLSLFINPYIKNHAIFAFHTEGRGLFSNDMVLEAGARLGVLYSIGK